MEPAANRVAESLAGADSKPWIWCQIGAREHYALPRALHQAGLLTALVTDAWLPPASPFRRLPGRLGRRLGERYDEGLADARVCAFTGSLLALEARFLWRARADIWTRILARNEWFQDQAVARLRSSGLLAKRDGGRPAVFAYSYAARRILQAAREAGCTTILGQIDPGPLEEEIVARAVARHPELRPHWQAAPKKYWEAWRQECDLADRIVVNSHWSQAALVQKGVPSEKICVLPLAYDGGSVARSARDYPDDFTPARPLRVLFLGSLIVRKGIAEMLEATRLLRGAPVVFRFVGPEGLALPHRDRENPQLEWVGAVPRSDVHRYYRDADVFTFPTLSDGFGLTQLEAQSWGLPVIASRNCAEVVRHRHNGELLDSVSGDSIAGAIRWCLENPALLRDMSENALATAAHFRPAEVLAQFLAGSARTAGASVAESREDV